MASNKMLIDATHPEETRVVVLRNGRVEEFDYESASRKLLRGNIYLAKVTRVEPSLQAAFIDYGGNRHGFLAFNEIHPDYYQIPMADRQALLDEEAAAEAAEEAAADARAERMARRRQRQEDGESRDRYARDRSETRESEAPADDEPEAAGDDVADDDEAPRDDAGAEEEGDKGPTSIAAEAARDEVVAEEPAEPETAGGFEGDAEADNDDDEEEDEDDTPAAEASETQAAAEQADAAPASAEISRADESGESGVQVVAAPAGEAEAVEQTGSEDALEELPSRPRRRPRSYKIQEVIKRRQVILVQVVKEERGNKGAALTTYLSLAGRYTVLMPNTARGGGISRKITNPQDRKRLKAIAAELEVPEGMGLIIRTAGAARTKQEIKRDFEYLLRLWESVRDLTLQSTAPSLVYEEGNLIKRSIRDLYNKDVEDIVVAGEHAHKDAKDFMRMLMPSHTKNVVLHQDAEPLFTKFGIERQLNAMFSPYMTLKSGGYLVINQTEALVAIDVNSGKATREFSIEETALNTNLEAADEIARQLKLRDLAGLIVIDFIDMEEKRNNRAVERRLKDALRFDRARIQLGRISHFGLMEMSRQRLRSGVLEGSTSQCPHCQGTGIIRSTESVALAVLRGLEDALMAGARTSLVATTTAQVALYILNNKRHFITEMEQRHGMFIAVQASEKLQGANFTIEKGHVVPVATRRPDRAAVNMDWGFEGEGAAASAEGEAETYREDNIIEVDAADDAQPRDEGGRHEGGGRRRRRRRGGRNGDRDHGERHGRDRGERHGSGRQPTADAGDFNGEVSDAAGAADASRGYDGDEGEGEAMPAEAGPSRREEGSGGRRRSRGRRGGRRGRDRGRGPHATAERGEGSGDEYAERAGADQAYGDDGEQQPRRGMAPDDPQPIIPREPAAREPVARERVSHEPAAREPEAAPREAETVAAERPAPAARTKTPEPVAAEVAAPPPKSRARNAATSSEPKLERVVVKPGEDTSAAAEPAPATPEPARRGWWQRRLGAE